MSAYGYDSPRRRTERAVREEMRRIRRNRPADARRRARARQDAADAAKMRRRHYETLIVLVATAIFIVGWDHERGPVRIDPTGVTTTLPSHPEVRAR